jgi:ABC-type transport system involved in multi-copper enzyme maturation permease subunit
MAVYKRNYRAYAGPVNPARWRWLVITRHALDEVFSSRVTTLLFVLCLTPALMQALIIYLVNNEAVATLVGLRGPGPSIGPRFFFITLQIQGWLALFLTAWIGPAMISPDLTNGALPLYLSRPIARAEYVAGKLLVLLIILSAVTWLPCLLLFALQAGLSKAPWLGPNLFLASGMFAGAWLWIALLALLALALSAWVRWRIVATGLVVAIIFIPSGFGAVISAVLRTKWGFLLNVPVLLSRIWGDLLRVDIGRPISELPVSAAWLVLLAVSGVSLMLLSKRVKACQVVRG